MISKTLKTGKIIFLDSLCQPYFVKLQHTNPAVVEGVRQTFLTVLFFESSKNSKDQELTVNKRCVCCKQLDVNDMFDSLPYSSRQIIDNQDIKAITASCLLDGVGVALWVTCQLLSSATVSVGCWCNAAAHHYWNVCIFWVCLFVDNIQLIEPLHSSYPHALTFESDRHNTKQKISLSSMCNKYYALLNANISYSKELPIRCSMCHHLWKFSKCGRKSTLKFWTKKE